jgi:hypothetical protein
MLDEKKKIEKYFQNPDANPKPEGVKFVKPFSVSPSGK